MILQDKHIVPVLAPADITTAATNTSWVNTAQSTWLTFLMVFGAASGTTIDIAVEAASAAASTSAEQVNFRYRLTGTAGNDTMGAVTFVSSTVSEGYSVGGSSVQNKIVIIDVDPKDCPVDHPYISVLVTGSSGNNIVGAVAVTTPYVARAVPTSTS